MRPFFTLFALLTLIVQLQAQITIERSDFTLEPGLTVKTWDLDFSNTSPPEAGEGMVWDFSALPLVDGFSTKFDTASSPEFPDANIVEPLTLSLLGNLATQEQTSYKLLDEEGYGSLGEVSETLSVPLQIFTGGASDTLTALGVLLQHPERKFTIRFPLNYGDSWSYDIPENYEFIVTALAFGLQNAPAGQTIRDSARYSVAGYGTLILPNPNGMGSVSLEALMVKRERELTNSYTLGGMPAPQPLLDLFGLEQDEVIQSTHYFFFAKGLPRSAANIRLNSQGEITSFTIADDIAELVSSTSTAAAPAPVRVFPNPAGAGATLSIQIPARLENGAFTLWDAFGRQVDSRRMDGLQDQMIRYALPANLQAGVYVYRITDENGKIEGIGKLNVTR